MKTIGVIGAGTMGSGIAYVSSTAGFEVFLHDLTEDLLERGLASIKKNASGAIEKGLVSASEAEETLRRIHLYTDLASLSSAELIIEAAVEDFGIKQKIFRTLDAVCSAGCLLATNTSSLSITQIASATTRPERVAGMHFFNPPHIMKLIEVVYGHHTSADTIMAILDVSRQLGKHAVVVRDTPGFIVNRVARPFYGEALRLLGEGVSTIEEIDRIVRLEGGFKMGPFELMDLIGIDVNYAVTQSIYEQYFHEPRYRAHPIQKRMVDAGLLGRKTKKGFYEYEDEG